MKLTVRAVPPTGNLYDAVLDRSEQGLVAVFHGFVPGGVPGTHPMDAAQRGVDAFLRESPPLPPGASLYALAERAARATRQAGEAHAGHLQDVDWWTAEGGGGFTPNPSSHANAFAVQAAFVRVSGGVASIAALGGCAALLLRWGTLQPLHPLDTVVMRKPRVSICARALGMGGRLAEGLHELTLPCEPGDRFVLLSPDLAAPYLAFGERPPETLDLTDTPALLEWLASCVPPRGELGLGGRGLAAVVTLD